MTIQTIRYDSARDTKETAPFGRCVGLAAPSNVSIVTRVVTLFLSSGPVAIVRRVSDIVVSTFKLVTGARAWSHIGKECLKAFAPTWTYGNTPAAVVMVAGVICVFAASNHAESNTVFRGTRFSMSSGLFCRNLTPEASTGLGVSRPQGIGQNGQNIAARTDASAYGSLSFARSCGGRIGDRESPEDTTIQALAYAAHSNILHDLRG